MNEDQDRTRLGHKLQNLAVLRHVALNAMQQEPPKDPLRGKLQQAARNDTDLTEILALIWNAIALLRSLTLPLLVLRPRPSPPRTLPPTLRQAVLDLLRSPRFADLAPAEVYATLLDKGVYHCSTPLGALAPGRTMYRILGFNSEVRARRQQLRHPAYAKPELLAEAPNQVWSWNITTLMGPAK